MKVKEVLEKTKEMTLLNVAKELEVGRDRLRNFLNEIGCEHKRGTSEWLYKGDNVAMLNENIYDHVHKTPPPNAPKKRTSKSPNTSNIIHKYSGTSNNASNNDIISASGGANSMKAEIQALIKGEQDNKPAKVYKGIYFDHDIATFLNNVKQGNKSELVNKIIRAYLKENDLI